MLQSNGSMIAPLPTRAFRKSTVHERMQRALLTTFRKGEYAPEYFTLRSIYLQGRPPKSVNMYWRRFVVSSIPLKDAKAFESWLLNRWKEKDALLEGFYDTGRFPADSSTSGGDVEYIETEVKLRSWLEVGQIFVVLGAMAMVANVLAKLWEMMT